MLGPRPEGEALSSLHSGPRFVCLKLRTRGKMSASHCPGPLTCAHVCGELSRLQEEPEVAALLCLQAGHPVAGH